MENIDKIAEDIVDKFADTCRISKPKYAIVDKGGENYLSIYVGKINKIYANVIAKTKAQLDESNLFKNNMFLKEQTPKSWLRSTEISLLQSLLAESLTIGRSSLESDFYKNFTPFLDGQENLIISKTNNVIYGRRGAGKSSLILYSCNQAKKDKIPFVWIAMQQYHQRDDFQVIPQFLYELTEQCVEHQGMEFDRAERLKKIIYKLEDKGESLTIKELKISLPLFAREFLPFVREKGYFLLFIDDLHLLQPEFQSVFLSAIYSFARGNNIFLKITAIENLTQLYNENKNEGLQPPGDVQIVRLDYNLVNPQATYDHIINILNSYIKYVGIPSIISLCSKEATYRLVWVSAGVPRDALYVFNNSISKALSLKRKNVAVTDINMSSADSMIEKERYLSDDVKDETDLLKKVIADIKNFCIKDINSNAFLVHIENSDIIYQTIKKLIDLRFIHMLHPGITPERAGEKYEVMMLDYAFYTGFRKTSSISEFKPVPSLPAAKELRKLKRYNFRKRIAL
ncbi:MAG: ATP-binding protein [Desulfobacterales bacterium]|nr:ATP-binding protein [Desulfobacterales bacterium]